MTWGYHLIVKASNCNPYAIRSYKLIDHFARKLVKDIDMVAYGQPMIHHFGSGDKAGYTLVQLIETSNITAHFCEESGDAFIDVFSCKPFSRKKVEALIEEVFVPKTIETQIILR
jgi:S-adenosylmethionine/arginine decarboxylase-like enzyme